MGQEVTFQKRNNTQKTLLVWHRRVGAVTPRELLHMSPSYVTVTRTRYLISHRSTHAVLSLHQVEATQRATHLPGSQNCTKAQVYPGHSSFKSHPHSHVRTADLYTSSATAVRSGCRTTLRLTTAV